VRPLSRLRQLKSPSWRATGKYPRHNRGHFIWRLSPACIQDWRVAGPYRRRPKQPGRGARLASCGERFRLGAHLPRNPESGHIAIGAGVGAAFAYPHLAFLQSNSPLREPDRPDRQSNSARGLRYRNAMGTCDCCAAQLYGPQGSFSHFCCCRISGHKLKSLKKSPPLTRRRRTAWAIGVSQACPAVPLGMTACPRRYARRFQTYTRH